MRCLREPPARRWAPTVASPEYVGWSRPWEHATASSWEPDAGWDHRPWPPWSSLGSWDWCRRSTLNPGAAKPTSEPASPPPRSTSEKPWISSSPAPLTPAAYTTLSTHTAAEGPPATGIRTFQPDRTLASRKQEMAADPAERKTEAPGRRPRKSE